MEQLYPIIQSYIPDEYRAFEKKHVVTIRLIAEIDDIEDYVNLERLRVDFEMSQNFFFSLRLKQFISSSIFRYDLSLLNTSRLEILLISRYLGPVDNLKTPMLKYLSMGGYNGDISFLEKSQIDELHLDQYNREIKFKMPFLRFLTLEEYNNSIDFLVPLDLNRYAEFKIKFL